MWTFGVCERRCWIAHGHMPVFGTGRHGNVRQNHNHHYVNNHLWGFLLNTEKPLISCRKGVSSSTDPFMNPCLFVLISHICECSVVLLKKYTTKKFRAISNVHVAEGGCKGAYLDDLTLRSPIGCPAEGADIACNRSTGFQMNPHAVRLPSDGNSLE